MSNTSDDCECSASEHTDGEYSDNEYYPSDHTTSEHAAFSGLNLRRNRTSSMLYKPPRSFNSESYDKQNFPSCFVMHCRQTHTADIFKTGRISTATAAFHRSIKDPTFINSADISTEYLHAGIVCRLVVQNRPDMFLIVQQKNGKWGFPKGAVESYDKTIMEGAIRETHEETGMRLGIDYRISLSTWSYKFTPSTKNLHESTQQFFLADAIPTKKWPPTQRVPTDHDIIDTQWATLNDLLILCKNYVCNVLISVFIVEYKEICNKFDDIYEYFDTDIVVHPQRRFRRPHAMPWHCDTSETETETETEAET